MPPPPGTTGVWSGKDQARANFEFSKSQNVHEVLVGSWQVTGATATGTGLVTVNDFVKWGVGAVQHQFEFVVQNGKIKSITATMAEFERPRVQAAAQAYAAAHPASPPGMPTSGWGAVPMSVWWLVLGSLGSLGAGMLLLRAAARRRRGAW